MRHTSALASLPQPCVALVAASVLASAICAGRPGLAQDANSEGRSELILQNLPPKGSKAYNDLLGRAGKTANGQVLGFTESEMWSMPTSRIEDVIRQARPGREDDQARHRLEPSSQAAECADGHVAVSGSDDAGHERIKRDDGRRHDGIAERGGRRVCPDEGLRCEVGDRQASCRADLKDCHSPE